VIERKYCMYAHYVNKVGTYKGLEPYNIILNSDVSILADPTHLTNYIFFALKKLGFDNSNR